tara:strand:- start:807 stop:1268 length:462 start_codon:yes stop_codon:yes gene_type:complete
MNSAHAGFAPTAFLMFLTGIGIPILATFNAQLGQQLTSPVAATFVLFAVGFILSAIVLVATGGFPDASRFTMDRPYLYFAAAFMLAYVLSITWAAPRIGIGNAVFFVLLGQLIAAALIDHFGLWGAMVTTLTPRRLVGIAVMALGVYLARKPV